jgi:hypothetical protein
MTVAYDEYAPAQVDDVDGARRPGHPAPSGVSHSESVLDTGPRSVSVVCRLCHGDLDESLFCSLCGVVTLP